MTWLYIPDVSKRFDLLDSDLLDWNDAFLFVSICVRIIHKSSQAYVFDS